MNGRLLGTVGLGVALLWAAGAVARPWPAPVDPQAVAEGSVEVDISRRVLPELEAIRAEAEGHLALLDDIRGGEGHLRDALPDVIDLADPVALRARLAALDEAGIARAAVRDRWEDLALSSRLQRRLAATRAAALARSAAADDAERTVLFELLSVADRLDGLTPQARHAAEAALVARRAEQDADTPEGLTEIARIDAARVRWRRLLDDAMVASWRGAPLDVQPELDALAIVGRTLGLDAVARLDAVRPVLDLETRAQADAAIAAWRTRIPPPAVAEAGPVPEDDVARAAARQAAEQSLREATQRVEAPPLPDDASEARRDAYLAEAQAEATVWRARVERLAEAARHADAARAEREASRRAAELAAQVAQEGDGPIADLERASVAWTAAAWDAVRTWQVGIDAHAADRLALVETLEADAQAALDAAEAAGWLGNTAQVDSVYVRARARMVALREGIGDDPPRAVDALASVPARPDGDRKALLDEAGAAARQIEDPSEQAEALASVALARSAFEAEEEPGLAAREVAEEELAARVEALRRVKAVRHRLRSHVGYDARQADLGAWVTDVRGELRMMPWTLRAYGADRVGDLGRLRTVLFDARLLLSALFDLLWAVFALVLWWIARGRVAWAADRLASLHDVDTNRGRRAHDERVEAYTPVVHHAIDAIVAWSVAWAAAGVLDELALLIRGMALWSAWRAIAAGLLLLTAQADARREAPFVVTEEGDRLLRRGMRQVGIWLVVRYLAPWVFAELLYADVLAMMLTRAIDLVGFGLVVAVLAGWAPRLRRRVEPMRNNPRWVTFWTVERGALDPLIAPVRAVVLLAYLAGAASWDILQRRAAQQDAARSLLTLVDRIRQRTDDVSEPPHGDPVGPEVRARLCGHPREDGAVFPREVALGKLGDLVSGWQAEARRGLIVLTGDKGDGKRVFLDLATRRLTEQKLVVVRLDLDRRITEVQDLVGWLAGALSIDPVPPDIATLRKAIQQLPPRVIVVRHTERAFVRRVRGFDALRALFDTSAATGERHLWILSVHRPAWSYLTRLGPLVNTGVIRGVVDLPPLRPDQLRELVMRRTQAAGLTVSFRRLEDTGPFGAPPEIEHRRAIETYFRLLTDASGGCPQIALHLWAASLRKVEDGPLEVVVPPEFSAVFPQDLRPEELFVLAAVRLQERLGLDELEAQAVAEDDDVEAIVRALEQRGLVVVDRDRVSLATRQVVAITRALRRRHFLQWAV